MRGLVVGLSGVLPIAGQATDTSPIGVQWIQHINGSAIRLTADGWEAGIQSQAREPDRLWLQPDARVRDASDLSLAGDFAWRDDRLSVISRIDYHSLAPRPAFNHRERQDASLQTSVQRQFGVWRVAVDWQQFGEDYALPTDIWFAGDRERRALRIERPWAGGQINAEVAIERAGGEFHKFMIRQTRENDLQMFADIADAPKFESPQDVPFSILLPAFVTSELKTAFQIGFMLFLPFLVIDLVVSSVLMSLGMMMMSPMLVSLPFKLLLFVLVDGWSLLMGSLASSFV